MTYRPTFVEMILRALLPHALKMYFIEIGYKIIAHNGTKLCKNKGMLNQGIPFTQFNPRAIHVKSIV